MQNLLNDLTQLLKKDERFISEGKLLKNKVVEAALKTDEELLKLLLSDETTKKYFFKNINGIFVFDKIQFQKFVSNKTFLPDSYTAFTNKIGLTSNDEFISESNDVVLSWPYKDCVLEGGQTKEEEKRNEIFWNETLAPDEIDRLLSPKVFTNFKKYDKDGEDKVKDITLEDNLIIKGNNLLALHSLLPVYRGKVKLIYIDSPYNTNTSANTFLYNNSFNHSSWMTFMKNRIEVAKLLLSDDGILAMAIDHYELLYLGVLTDSIFDRLNRIGIISIVHNPGGRQDDKFFSTSSEFMLVYAKNNLHASINNFEFGEEKISNYKYEDEKGKYKLTGLQRTGNNSNRTERPNLFYPIYVNQKTNNISIEPKEGFIKLLPIDNSKNEKCWRWGKEKLVNNSKDVLIKSVNGKIVLNIKNRLENNLGEKPKTFWYKPEYSGQTGTSVLKNLMGEKSFTYPKSPHLVKDVLKVLSNKDDIILDFFGGSGTTGQAVIDLNNEDGGNRKFILCEQLDYIENVTVKRIKKVIEKNKSDDSFVYFELTKLNQNFTDQIIKSKNTKELNDIWENMKKNGFISYKINPKDIDANISEFEKLSIEDQRKFLIEVLDKNHLYVNYTEIEDKDYKISEGDKMLNKMFYKLK